MEIRDDGLTIWEYMIYSMLKDQFIHSTNPIIPWVEFSDFYEKLINEYDDISENGGDLSKSRLFNIEVDSYYNLINGEYSVLFNPYYCEKEAIQKYL